MILELRSVIIRQEGWTILGPIDCQVTPGTVTTLIGPSGSGKSTLLSWLIGALPPAFTAEGQVILGAEDITSWPVHARKLGILFQDDLLFPHLSVAENLGFALPVGLSRTERTSRIAAGLAEAELPGLGDRDPSSLSGGERARVALMRTLLAEPKALLLDEPFGKLDLPLRERFRTLVFEKARRRNLPVLMVTHDPADRLAAGGPVIDLGSVA